MPADYNGVWKMILNENFEEYLKALDVNVAVRKIATLLKPDKDIAHNGNHFIIKTISAFRIITCHFLCPRLQTTISWDDDKLVCVQRGEKQNRGWTHWIDGDELHLVRALHLHPICMRYVACMQNTYSV
uniref:Cytosolic fatty-acid binding proteins domain-containing protein n=1 Tax=Denticeps clupeoides TaxID=299321 RepID=A0AAY4BP00_9TELE